ncbi:hypothetical protein CIB48_g10731 [Xylaria polymorpha]|nr:hypothetical protein CIB48_g10731 [Xylaria polymorpha]
MKIRSQETDKDAIQVKKGSIQLPNGGGASTSNFQSILPAFGDFFGQGREVEGRNPLAASDDVEALPQGLVPRRVLLNGRDLVNKQRVEWMQLRDQLAQTGIPKANVGRFRLRIPDLIEFLARDKRVPGDDGAPRISRFTTARLTTISTRLSVRNIPLRVKARVIVAVPYTRRALTPGKANEAEKKSWPTLALKQAVPKHVPNFT